MEVEFNDVKCLLLLSRLKEGENKITELPNKLPFLSMKTIVEYLSDLSYKEIVEFDIKQNKLYFNVRYFKIVSFVNKFKFLDVLSAALKGIQFNQTIFTEDDLALLKNKSKIDQYSINPLLAHCLKKHYHDDFTYEVSNLNLFRFHEGKEKR